MVFSCDKFGMRCWVRAHLGRQTRGADLGLGTARETVWPAGLLHKTCILEHRIINVALLSHLHFAQLNQEHRGRTMSETSGGATWDKKKKLRDTNDTIRSKKKRHLTWLSDPKQRACRPLKALNT